MTPIFLITRSDPRDDRLCAEAESLGYAVVREALLTTGAGVDAPVLPERLETLPDGEAVAWTSRRAADMLALTLADSPQARSRLDRAPLFALGEESAAPVLRAGLKIRVPEVPQGAAELARFIADRAASDGIARVLFLHGNRSLPDLPDGLKARGIDVEYLQVYRTDFLPADLGGLEVALRNGAPIVASFYSPSGVEALERFLTGDSLARFRARAMAVARGATTARALEARGYRSVLVPDRGVAFDPFLVEALHAPSGGRT